MKRLSLLIALFVGFHWTATAQIEPGERTVDSNIVTISTRDMCASYEIDVRIVDDQDNIIIIMDSLRQVQPNALPLMSQWCRQQRRRVNRLLSSLQNDYALDNEKIWIDSTHLIPDAAEYMAKLESLIPFLEKKAVFYEEQEQLRLESERRAAEERAHAEAMRIQQEKAARLTQLTDSIRDMNREIADICDAKGITDKARIKELKELYYAYLSVFNRYDLTSRSTDDNRFTQLYELKIFQTELIDSVLSQSSYIHRIDSFKDVLKLRCGKDHADVNKSYLKVFKKVQVPVSFKTIAEYREYVKSLRDIITVQESYLKVIELRDSIVLNNNTLQLMCSKKHREIFSSYKEVLSEIQQIPAYTTKSESRKFISNLRDFIELQGEYMHAIQRIDVIEVRSDSITALCNRKILDISTSYKELVGMTDFVPKFRNKSGADYFNKTLDEFESMQQEYISIIGLRNTIATKAQRITESKNAPRGLINGYRNMSKYTNFTPRFNNVRDGKEFSGALSKFIVIQDKYIAIIDTNEIIENTAKKIKSSFKDYGNITKAYERLIKAYEYELNIVGETDLDNYMQYQTTILAIQQRFVALIDSYDKEDYNRRLKKEKDPEKIKLIMGI